VLSGLHSLPCCEVVFDYGEPPCESTPDTQRRFEKRAKGVAAVDEPWKSFFVPQELEKLLSTIGFAKTRNYGYSFVESYFVAQTKILL
jgi:O-methyltransferase involved in polyketide biosynthesis